MNFTTFLTAVILLTMFATTYSVVLADVSTTYNISTNTSFTNPYSNINTLINKTQQINNQVQGEGSQEGDIETSFLKIGFSTIAIVYSSITLVIAMLTDLGSVMGLPSYMIGGIIAILIVILGLYAVTIFYKSFNQL